MKSNLEVDASIFKEAASELNMRSPVFTEKDYYAIQLLKVISELSFENYDLVFAGGTCLTKAHKNTFRMSEDIDIKLVPKNEALGFTRSQKRKNRKVVHREILSAIDSSIFSLAEQPRKRNEGQYFTVMVDYPKSFDQDEGSLRPILQLEVTESALLESAQSLPIRSICAELGNKEPEVPSIKCVSIQSTTAEKFVALLRRTAVSARDESKADDKTLVRHVYDLHIIGPANLISLGKLVNQVIDTDAQQFGAEAFKENPKKELRYGLACLVNDPKHKARYNEFLGPLVYHPEPAQWGEALATIELMAKTWLTDKEAPSDFERLKETTIKKVSDFDTDSGQKY